MASRKVPTAAASKQRPTEPSNRPIESVEEIEKLQMDISIVLAPEAEQEDVIKRPAWAPHMGHLWMWLREEVPPEQVENLTLRGDYHLGVGQLSRGRWKWTPKVGAWTSYCLQREEVHCWAAAHADRHASLGRLVCRPLPSGPDYQAPLATLCGLVREVGARAAPTAGSWREEGDLEPESYWQEQPLQKDERVYAAGRHEFYVWRWEDAFVIMNEEAWFQFSNWFSRMIKKVRKLEAQPSGALRRPTKLEWIGLEDKPIYIPLDKEHHRALLQLAGRQEKRGEKMVKVIYLPKTVIRLHYPVASERSTEGDGSPKYETTRTWTSKEQDWGVEDILGALATLAKKHEESALQWYCVQSGDVLQAGTDFYFTLTPRLPRQ